MQDFKQGEMVHARNSGWKEGEFLKLPFVVKYKDNFWCESGDGAIVMFDFVNHIPKPELIPFTSETLPKCRVLIRAKSWPDGNVSTVYGWDKETVHFNDNSRLGYKALVDRWLISTDNCKTWRPAGVVTDCGIVIGKPGD